MSTVAQRLLTAEEFANLPPTPYGYRDELVRGVVDRMSLPRFLHGKCQVRIGGILDAFVHPRKLGHGVTETGVITDRDPDTVRGPDVSFWSVTRVPLGSKPDPYPEIAPDLCVEVLSPGQAKRITEKMREYFAADVRIVWVVDPEARTATIYRQPDQGKVLHETDTLTGEDVLPGFSCRVAEFFD